MPALAEAGFHAIALDMRGYGESEAPVGIENYTSFHVVGDIIGVLDALGDKTGTFISDTHSKPKILSLKFRLKKWIFFFVATTVQIVSVLLRVVTLLGEPPIIIFIHQL